MSLVSASYPLAEIKRLIANEEFWITRVALDGALALGFDDQDIRECICDYLEGTHFYKTMVATKKAGFMQDVYRITYETVAVYLKVQIVDGNAIIISFKADESA